MPPCRSLFQGFEPPDDKRKPLLPHLYPKEFYNLSTAGSDPSMQFSPLNIQYKPAKFHSQTKSRVLLSLPTYQLHHPSGGDNVLLLCVPWVY